MVEVFLLLERWFLSFQSRQQKCGYVQTVDVFAQRPHLSRTNLDSHRTLCFKYRFPDTRGVTMCVWSVAILLTVSLVCACIAGGQPSKAAVTGIKGVILVSPIRPGPVTKGSEFPNTAPIPNAKFSVSSDERTVTTFTTDADGRFQVLVKPGRYSVLLAENRFPRACGPFEVSVEEGRMTDVQWRCDSGMR